MDRDRYFKYLIGKISSYKFVDVKDYGRLLKFLFSHEFVWSNRTETDANRADDGIRLRLLYFQDEKILSAKSDMRQPCSILEMMVALAIRIDADIMGEAGEKSNAGKWFWEMLANLGLANQTNSMYDEGYVTGVVETWLGRAYKKDGDGGLFPLRRTRVDQRNVPIWDQMGEYLVENY